MKNNPLLIKLQHLQQTNPRQFYAACGGAGFVLLMVLMLAFSGGTPAPQPVQQAAPKAVTPPPAETADAKTLVPLSPEDQNVLELFNPSDEMLSQQLDSSAVSQQIEQALTVSFMLSHCHIISEYDYRNTFNALVLYAQQTKLATNQAEADARVRKIAEAAGAGYSLVYSRTKCTDPSLQTSATDLARWVAAIQAR